MSMVKKIKKKYYFYAETAFSHEGDFAYLKKLVDAVELSDVDGIKFQILISPEESYCEDLLKNGNIYKLCFNKEQWIEILDYAKNQKGLDVIALPVDMEAVYFCEKNIELIDAIEIHSVNFNHIKMLEKINKLEKVCILGIGGRTLDEIQFCIDKMQNLYLQKKIVLMHGFQSFPTKAKNVKMSRITKLKELYELPVGYADHSSFDSEEDIKLMGIAFALGARIFEKHIVIEKGIPRIDYEAATDYEHIKKLKSNLNEIEEILDESNCLIHSQAETRYREREKQIVAAEKISKGEKITKEKLTYIVTNEASDFEQKDFEKICQCFATENIEKGESIKYKHIEKNKL